MTPHHQYTLPLKQAKIVLKSVFLNKINTLSVVILWLPTFWLSKILWSLYFPSKKIMTHPVYLGPPILKKLIAPLWRDRCIFFNTVLITHFWPGTQNSLILTEYATYRGFFPSTSSIKEPTMQTHSNARSSMGFYVPQLFLFLHLIICASYTQHVGNKHQIKLQGLNYT